MSTRFYFPSTVSAPSISPAYGGSGGVWDDTNWAQRRKTFTSKTSSATTFVGVSGDSDTTDKDYLIRQFVSEPITAQTLSAGSFDFCIQGIEAGAANNLVVSIFAFVVSSDGNTDRGTLISLQRDNTEFDDTDPYSRYHSGSTSEVEASEGDRIVIEFGVGGDPTPGGNHDATLGFGDDGTDLPETDDETEATWDGWLELSIDVSFVEEEGSIIPQAMHHYKQMQGN